LTDTDPNVLFADLTDWQRDHIKQVLDGIVRERSGGSGPPC